MKKNIKNIQDYLFDEDKYPCPAELLVDSFKSMCSYNSGVVRDRIYDIAVKYSEKDFASLLQNCVYFEDLCNSVIIYMYKADPVRFSLNNAIREANRKFMVLKMYDNIEEIMINYICNYLISKDINEVDNEKFDKLVQDIDLLDLTKDLKDINAAIDSFIQNS